MMRSRWLLPSTAFILTVLPCAGAEAKPVLWQPPGTTTLRDWIWGPGGESRAPVPPFHFIVEDFNGTNPKIRVQDAKGGRWSVKFGGEDHGEVFASRLLYALGYVTEPSYFVARGVIAAAHDLRRAKPFVTKSGVFHYARFQLRDRRILARVNGETWSWNDNPFVGTHELNGLKILLMLTSNWDAKDARDGNGSNTGIYSRPGSANRLYYSFDDWGATMGKWGGFFARDKWNAAGYQEQSKDFARLTARHTIAWGYRGKHGKDITTGISAADVRWLLTDLSRVTDEDLRAGLRASGATDSEIEIYTRSIRARIAQLQRVSTDVPPATRATMLFRLPPVLLP